MSVKITNCDMCGIGVDILFKTLIEGVELNVCKQCSRFGKVVRSVKVRNNRKEVKKAAVVEKPKEPEIIEMIVDDYAEIIKNARERSRLKPEELANKINEKTSLVQNVEKGKFKPSMNLARKLEGFLRVTLIESVEDSKEGIVKSKGDGLTIADFIKVKR